MNNGALVISIDFELFWGLRDKRGFDNYKENLVGVRKAIPAILELFKEFGIHATWSTVGLLFFESKKELNAGIPKVLPEYENTILSPYHSHIKNLGENEATDPLRFAPSVIKKIVSYPNQRVGSHTFSHYYCLEKGQNINSFREDLLSAISIAKKRGIKLESLVFPCNQYNQEYIKVCEELGIKSYRGNELSWLYSAKNGEDETFFRRLCRLTDSYINISGHNVYSWDQISKNYPINIPSSRFLRPYSQKFKFLMPLKLKRIKTGLTYAAKNKQIYHLWWHPHNFGKNTTENINTLRNILEHYSFLKYRYNFQSLNIEEVAEKVLEVKKYETGKNSDVSGKR